MFFRIMASNNQPLENTLFTPEINEKYRFNQWKPNGNNEVLNLYLLNLVF